MTHKSLHTIITHGRNFLCAMYVIFQLSEYV